MKYIKCIILFISILNFTKLTGQQINLTDVKSDISFLIKKLEEVHPNPYFHINKKDFQYSIDSLLNDESVKHNVSSLQFWKTFAPIVSSLKDGHTELALPNHAVKDYYNDKSIVFPFEVDILDSKLLLVKNYSTDRALKVPLEVSKINSISVVTIISTLRKYISAELDGFQNKIIITRFQRYFIALFNSSETYDIEFVDGSKQVYKSIKRSEFLKNRSKYINSEDYNLTFDKQYAILEINSFEGSLKRFKRFLRKSFREIKKQNASIIIDLRNNGGGDSRFGDELLKYLSEKQIQQVDTLMIKSSKTAKEYLRVNYLKWRYYLLYPFLRLNPVTKATFFNDDGEIYTYTFKDKKRKSKKFYHTEKVFLITSSKTFSSANLFANAFKCYKLGDVIGESTGGTSIFYGDVIKVKLPNSKIELDISFKKFLTPCSKESANGVEPDVYIKNNSFLDKDEALNYILNRK